MTAQDRADWRLACLALAALVREEYPPHPLAYIAETWGGGLGSSIPAEQVSALAALEDRGDL
jgi:hypothetical protein